MEKMVRLDEVLSVNDASGGARRLTGSTPWSMIDLWNQYSTPDFEPEVDVGAGPTNTSAPGPENPMDNPEEDPNDEPETAADGPGGYGGGDLGDEMPGHDQVKLDADETHRQQSAERHQNDVSGQEEPDEEEDDDPLDPVPPKRIREVSKPKRNIPAPRFRYRENAEFMTVDSVLEGDGY